jgi:hypothetical protein
LDGSNWFCNWASCHHKTTGVGQAFAAIFATGRMDKNKALIIIKYIINGFNNIGQQK